MRLVRLADELQLRRAEDLRAPPCREQDRAPRLHLDRDAGPEGGIVGQPFQFMKPTEAPFSTASARYPARAGIASRAACASSGSTVIASSCVMGFRSVSEIGGGQHHRIACRDLARLWKAIGPSSSMARQSPAASRCSRPPDGEAELALQQPELLVEPEATARRIEQDARPRRHLDLHDLEPGAGSGRRDAAPDIAAVGIGPDRLLASPRQRAALAPPRGRGPRAGTPSPAQSRSSSAAVGLDSPRSTREIMARLTPERSASWSSVRPRLWRSPLMRAPRRRSRSMSLTESMKREYFHYIGNQVSYRSPSPSARPRASTRISPRFQLAASDGADLCKAAGKPCFHVGNDAGKGAGRGERP